MFLLFAGWWVLVGVAIYLAYQWAENSEDISPTFLMSILFGPFLGFIIMWKQKQLRRKNEPEPQPTVKAVSRADLLRRRNSLEDEGEKTTLIQRILRQR